MYSITFEGQDMVLQSPCDHASKSGSLDSANDSVKTNIFWVKSAIGFAFSLSSQKNFDVPK